MNDIEEIKKRIDIIDFVGQYVTLKKSGTNFKAVCPFHSEKTPSMMVSPEKQIFKCFGCGEGGDIFSFLMKIENLEFGDALKMLAERAGVKLQLKTTKAPDFQDKKSRLYAINRWSAKLFNKLLLEHPVAKRAREYLQGRNISPELIEKYLIGYAPHRRILADFLKQKGFSEAEIRLAGSPERFSNRIIFPIRDNLGNIVAFTGRVLNPEELPKYINTPETPIFNKSRVLYGLDTARNAIKEKDFVIIVEGQTDVIACQSHGYENTVASSGTALTELQLKSLMYLTNNIYLAYDQDPAGRKATKRAFELANELDLNVKIVDSTSHGKDPAEIITNNPADWDKAVKEALNVIDYYMQKETEKYAKPYTAETKKKIAKELLPYLRLLANPIESDHYIQTLARVLDTKEEIILKALEKINLPSTGSPSSEAEPTAEAKKDTQAQIEEIFIHCLLTKPTLLTSLKSRDSKVLASDLEDEFLQGIYKLLLKEYNEKDNVWDFLKTRLSRADLTKLNLLLTSEAGSLVSEENIDQEFLLVIQRITGRRKDEIKQSFAQQIAEAEKNKDFNKVKELIKEFQNAISTQN